MSRRKWVALLSGVVLITGLIGVSSYLIDTDKKVNTFNPGYNDIEPEEEFDTPEPGEYTRKNPRVSNVGNIDCYVRARVVLSDDRASDYLEYSYSGDDSGMSSNWTLNEDGYYYYNTKLGVNETTDPIFNYIYLYEDIPDYLKGFTIDVYFESVQAYGFDDALTAFSAIE